ncbi:MAG: CopG family ribbon-helix-helix protein [Candidatus Methanomethylicia archaeon]|nr:CopG family ribbon-helix-helix protein [Candidatus Methanomethylicia archaeon]MCX8169187.1 CopG family ribbon-helix-helix protein [Candidatus Methanomethylicia archaeon]MDW7989031.1 CopG family ribbon-helix-helix protein [Nitrososphaerota archaeon]
MSSRVKTGVSFKEDTLRKLDKYMERMNLDNRSKIIDEAIQLYLSERSLIIEEGVFGGVIAVYFEHEAEQELTKLQHKFLDVVISNTHVHLNKENCIEAILVKGEAQKIKNLISELEKIKGLTALRFNFFKIL